MIIGYQYSQLRHIHLALKRFLACSHSPLGQHRRSKFPLRASAKLRRNSSGESKTVTLEEEEGRKVAKPRSLASRWAKPVNKILKDRRKKTL
jgi:hypothetical protein